ncbi:MAG: hypothetical protein ABI789_02870 [Usitatibacter sp.]
MTFAAVLASVNFGVSLWRVQGKAPPEYGTWTGVLQVERKIRLLHEFCRDEPVDALILSSSMGDLGVSADVLTHEISAALGRKYRVFNFGMGGADFSTYPLLYRFARMVCKPKEIWVVAPASTNPGQKDSLDDILLKGPVGHLLEWTPLLRLSFELHDIALARNAAAIRDFALNASFVHRPITNLDLYEIDPYGDTVSWLYNPTEGERRATHRINRHDHIMKFVRQPNAEGHRQHHRLYFSDRTLGAVYDLRDLAKRDHATLTVVPFDTATGLTMRDSEFLDASKRFFEPLARYYEARLADVRPAFDLRPHMVSDMVHLNSIGAAEFSKLLAAQVTGRPAPPPPQLAGAERFQEEVPDPHWTTFTALLVKKRGDPSASLELQYFQNWGLPAMRPFSNYRVAIRLPDGSEKILPARVGARGHVVVDTSGLALEPVDQILTAQIVTRKATMGAGMGVPLASYRWSADRRPPAFWVEGLAGVESGALTYSTVDPISVRWERLRDPGKHDWIGLFPVDGNLASRLSFAFVGGKEAGELTLPAVPQPGEFELRLFRDKDWDAIAASKTFTVTPLAGSVAVADATVAAGGAVNAKWSDLNHPHKQDWIGLFAKGAKDDARIDFRYTGGALNGTLQIPVPESLRPGEYEVRLFSSGGWTRLATSAAFTIAPPQPVARPAT